MKAVKKFLYILFLAGWLAPLILGLDFWATRGCEATLECSFPFTATAIKLFAIAGVWFILALLKIKPWKRTG